MTAEGWGGKSLREIIQGGASAAEDARYLAETGHDEIAALRAELDELQESVACLKTCNCAGGDGV